MTDFYYLRGPINNKAQVLLAVTIDKYLYFLTRSGPNLIFDPRNPLLLGSSEPLIFNVNIPSGNSNLNFGIVQGGNVGLSIDNYGMVTQNPPSNLIPSAIDLNAGSLVVAGGDYSFTGNAQTVKFYTYTPVPPQNASTTSVFAPDILLDPNGHAVLQTITGGIRMVPIKWFLAANCAQTVSSINDVITNESRWVQNTELHNNATFQTGFTLQSDCNNGIFYNYCFLPASCGEANNCFGGCANSAQTCQLNKNTQTFTCSNSSSSSSSNVWWIVLISVVAAILLLLLIVGIWYAFRTPKTTVIETTNTSPSLIQNQYIPAEQSYVREYEGESILL
jgi:hypothetical protein